MLVVMSTIYSQVVDKKELIKFIHCKNNNIITNKIRCCNGFLKLSTIL